MKKITWIFLLFMVLGGNAMAEDSIHGIVGFNDSLDAHYYCQKIPDDAKVLDYFDWEVSGENLDNVEFIPTTCIFIRVKDESQESLFYQVLFGYIFDTEGENND